MQAVKKAKDYTVYKKRSGRFAVLNPQDKYIRGEEKVKILLKEGLITLTPAKPKDVPAADAAAAAPAEAK